VLVGLEVEGWAAHNREEHDGLAINKVSFGDVKRLWLWCFVLNPLGSSGSSSSQAETGTCPAGRLCSFSSMTSPEFDSKYMWPDISKKISSNQNKLFSIKRLDPV